MKDNIELICDIAERIAFADEGEDRGVLLQDVAYSIAEHMAADVCSIYIYDEIEKTLFLRATQGLDMCAVGSVKLSLEEGITGQALRELRPICVGQASRESAYKFFPGIKEEQYEAFLAVPIIRGTRKIGVLVLQATECDYFKENDVSALRAIATQLATMFESVKLLKEARKGLGIKEIPSITCSKDILRGRSASKGVAKGVSCVLDARVDDYDKESQSKLLGADINAFESALKRTIDQIKELQVTTSEQLADVAVLIFSAHLLILEDEQFTGRIRELIIDGVDAFYAVNTVVNEYVQIFSNSAVPMIQEKILDVKDLGKRLGRNLSFSKEFNSDYSGQIVAVKELLPSDILKFSAENVEGLIICSGVTSHNAIICRSLRIPMVAVSRDLFESIPDGLPLLMDASQGIIYLNPNDEILNQYMELEKTWNILNDASDIKDIRRTSCGEIVEIMANINLLSDLEPARHFKANGIGLYRSEFPFIVRNDFPSEEEQTHIYSRLVDSMNGLPVTLRTLDIGGDKMLSYYSNVTEANPFLGMRAIRFSLQNRDIFSQQLRAFLRAGVEADARIMFPLIASVDDFIAAREIVFECMDQLEGEGVQVNRQIQLGVMMELPSAVEVAEELATEADFLSIGSNDLVQYMLAVDRTNEQVSELYKSHHPAILRAINRIVIAAKQADKPVSICGDLATETHMIPFLLGIGLRTLSIDIGSAPAVERAVSLIDIAKAEEFSSKLLKMGKIQEIEALIQDQV